MSDEWGRYKKILDREDEEFRRAMEAEVSTIFLSEFSNKYRILAGVDIIMEFSNKYRILAGIDIITQYPLDFTIFK